jgi:hypothetical protein
MIPRTFPISRKNQNHMRSNNNSNDGYLPPHNHIRYISPSNKISSHSFQSHFFMSFPLEFPLGSVSHPFQNPLAPPPICYHDERYPSQGLHRTCSTYGENEMRALWRIQSSQHLLKSSHKL